MGVPKFFRWISERYPCLSELITEHQVPEFDYLYLDMNGIIHICSHPEDDNVHFRITEEEIFNHVSHYISFLFRIIKPRKCFFMAVDGVAPRAKMNQQRGRRFKSAKLAEEQEKLAQQKGEKLPETKRFDSNCITPGTPFMVRLHTFLKYFVVKKISEDPLWQRTEIILSGHETPGEGEHKIQDYIRYIKSNKDFDPNSRHCLYGLDADLIMLGLVSHEPHFALLREEVKYTKQAKSNKRAFVPEEQKFFLLHLSLLREYIDYEFSDIKTSLSFDYNMECVIDDWILMSCLVGNDFIPHLPNLHIHGDALPLLWRTYKEVLPSLDGYLNESGKLNVRRFITYIRHLAKFDLEQFAHQSSDSKWMMGKRGAKLGLALETLGQQDDFANTQYGEGNDPDEEEEDGLVGFFGGEENVNESLYSVPKYSKKRSQRAPRKLGGENDNSGLTAFRFSEAAAVSDCYLEDCEGDDDKKEESEDSDMSDDVVDADDEEYNEKDLMKTEYQMQKRDYYLSKLHIRLNKESLEKQAIEYIRALQWILYYYYRGVPSWSWFYRQHYAPYLSDLTHFPDPDNAELNFDFATPFLPFEQLMAVLPAHSRDLLPASFQGLMVDTLSPLIDFYPQNFQTDLNGKKQEWEALVLIPFIDEDRMLAVIRPLYSQLTNEERERNFHGPHLQYRFSKKPQPNYPAILQSDWDGANPPGEIRNNHATVTHLKPDKFVTPRDEVILRLLPGANLKHYHVGFPTFRHLPHTFRVEKIGVKVFEMPSRHESVVLKLKDTEEPNTEVIARRLLQKPLFVNWPHFSDILVVKVCDNQYKYFVEDSVANGQNPNKSKTIKSRLNEKEVSAITGEVSRLSDFYKSRRGIEVGTTDLLVYGLPACGQRYRTVGKEGKVRLEKQWAQYPSLQPHLYQCSVENLTVMGSKHRVNTKINEVFPVDSIVFSLSRHYGYMGVVNKKPEPNGKISVELTTYSEPNLSSLAQMKEKLEGRYYPGYELARQLDVNSHFLSRITGSLFLQKSDSEEQYDDEEAAKPHSKSYHNKDFKLNIGLNLKFNRRNEEVPGWTRRSVQHPMHDYNGADQRGGSWEYSDKILNILDQYRQQFPEVFKYIRENTKNDIYVDKEIFPDNTRQRVKSLEEFLKNLPCTTVERLKQGHSVLCAEIIKRLENQIDQHKSGKTTVQDNFLPNELFMTMLSQGNLIPDTTTETLLFDRVVNVRPGFSVPLGYRGTVIGVLGTGLEDTIYEVLFDQKFEGALALRGSTQRCYRLPAYAIINLTYGGRRFGRGEAPSKRKNSQGQRNNQSSDPYGFQTWFSKDYHNVPPPLTILQSPRKPTQPTESSTGTAKSSQKKGKSKPPGQSKDESKPQTKEKSKQDASQHKETNIFKKVLLNKSTPATQSDNSKPNTMSVSNSNQDVPIVEDLTNSLKSLITPALDQNKISIKSLLDNVESESSAPVTSPNTAAPFSQQANKLNLDDFSIAASALTQLQLASPVVNQLSEPLPDPAIVTHQLQREQCDPVRSVQSQLSTDQQSQFLLSMLQKSPVTSQPHHSMPPPPPTQAPPQMNIWTPTSPHQQQEVSPSTIALDQFCARTGLGPGSIRATAIGPNIYVAQLELSNPRVMIKGDPQMNVEHARMSTVDKLLNHYKEGKFQQGPPLTNQIAPCQSGFNMPPQHLLQNPPQHLMQSPPQPRYGLPPQNPVQQPCPPNYGFQPYMSGIPPPPWMNSFNAQHPVLFNPNMSVAPQFLPPPMQTPVGPSPHYQQPAARNYHHERPAYPGANHRPFLPPELANDPFASDFYDSKNYLKYPVRLESRYSTLTDRQSFTDQNGAAYVNNIPDSAMNLQSTSDMNSASSVFFIPSQVVRNSNQKSNYPPAPGGHDDYNGGVHLTTAHPHATATQNSTFYSSGGVEPSYENTMQFASQLAFPKPQQQHSKKRSRIAASFAQQ